MFKTGLGLFGCENGWNCFEDFVIAVLSIASLYLFVRGYQIIRRDRAQVLDKMDKIIFYLAFVYISLLAFTYSIYGAPFLAYTIRALYLIQTVVICTVVGLNYFSEPQSNNLYKGMNIGLIWSALLWFLSVMDRRQADPDNECNKMIILFFSISALVLSAALTFFGYKSIQDIKAQEQRFTERGDGASDDSASDIIQLRQLQDLKERRIMLSILMIAYGIPSLIQFLWDIKKYHTGYSLYQCTRVTNATNFFNMFTFIAMKVFCYLLPCWGIYYLYYWRNKKNFKSELDWNKNNGDFDDLRSELIEMS